MNDDPPATGFLNNYQRFQHPVWQTFWRAFTGSGSPDAQQSSENPIVPIEAGICAVIELCAVQADEDGRLLHQDGYCLSPEGARAAIRIATAIRRLKRSLSWSTEGEQP